MVSRLDSELRVLLSSNKFIASAWRGLVRNLCGTWCSGLLAWSLGCVEVDLADDPGTIPAGSKPRPNRDTSTIATGSEQCQTGFWPKTEEFTELSHWAVWLRCRGRAAPFAKPSTTKPQSVTNRLRKKLFLRENLEGKVRPQRLKLHSKPCSCDSGEALRQPKSEGKRLGFAGSVGYGGRRSTT
jgi:hypothetical protein